MAESLQWGGSDAFTHMLVVGPTRCGKTSTILKPMIYQILLLKKRGVDIGLSVIEPKGDLARLVNEMCGEMDVPCVFIDPESEDSHSFNVMEGNKDDVAEAAVVVLQGLFGKQEAFFQTVQELSTRNITKLLKELYGDKIDIMDVLYTLRDQKLLEKQVKKLKQRDGETDLVQFFDNELLGSLADQYRKLVIGLRAQLENITSNDLLKRIITGKSDLNIDHHFETGGVLAVNTALGSLRKAGDAFGQFVIMHLQNGTFRRKGTEETRVPHFLIVDEYSRFINPDVEMFLSLAAEYKVSGIFATQSLGQLEIEAGRINARAMKTAILTSCRNKIAFGGLSATDAKEFSEEFGKDQIIMRQSTYKNKILLPKLFPDSYRDTEEEEYRFHFTYLMDGMPRFHYIHKLLEDGIPRAAGEGKGSFIPKDWKQLREWETGRSSMTVLKAWAASFKKKLEKRQAVSKSGEIIKTDSNPVDFLQGEEKESAKPPDEHVPDKESAENNEHPLTAPIEKTKENKENVEKAVDSREEQPLVIEPLKVSPKRNETKTLFSQSVPKEIKQKPPEMTEQNPLVKEAVKPLTEAENKYLNSLKSNEKPKKYNDREAWF